MSESTYGRVELSPAERRRLEEERQRRLAEEQRRIEAERKRIEDERRERETEASRRLDVLSQQLLGERRILAEELRREKDERGRELSSSPTKGAFDRGGQQMDEGQRLRRLAVRMRSSLDAIPPIVVPQMGESLLWIRALAESVEGLPADDLRRFRSDLETADLSLSRILEDLPRTLKRNAEEMARLRRERTRLEAVASGLSDLTTNDLVPEVRRRAIALRDALRNLDRLNEPLEWNLALPQIRDELEGMNVRVANAEAARRARDLAATVLTSSLVEMGYEVVVGEQDSATGAGKLQVLLRTPTGEAVNATLASDGQVRFRHRRARRVSGAIPSDHVMADKCRSFCRDLDDAIAKLPSRGVVFMEGRRVPPGGAPVQEEAAVTAPIEAGSTEKDSDSRRRRRRNALREWGGG